MVLVRRKKSNGRKSDTELSFARQLFKGAVRLILVGAVMVLIWYVARIDAFTISDITVVGGETISHDEIKARVHDELQGAYFLIIPKRFAYFYPQDRIVEVLGKIPRIYNVDVQTDSKKKLSITFDEYIPHALWCAEGDYENPCMLVDSSGYAFAPAPQLDGGTLVRHTVETTSTLAIGNVATKDEIEAIDSFIERLSKELGLRITALTQKRNGDIEFHINGGGKILVSGENNFESTFENLKSVLTSKEFKHLAPGNFQYIDVRFENKIFVNEEFRTASSTATST